MQTIHICLTTDENYAPYCAVTMASIIKNALENDRLQFYIFFSGQSDCIKPVLQMQTSKVHIEIIELGGLDFNGLPILDRVQFTPAVYFRYKIASILENIDKVLYLDCDIIVQASLYELYTIDIKDQYAAVYKMTGEFAAKETKRLGLKSYFSSGVMLINGKKWREDKIENALFAYAFNDKNKKHIHWPDQDVLNVVLQERVLFIDEKWNMQLHIYGLEPTKWNEPTKKAAILHFTGEKPWNPIRSCEIQDFYRKYAELVPQSFRINIKLYSDMSMFFKNQTHARKVYTLALNFASYLKNQNKFQNRPVAVVADVYEKETISALIMQNIRITYYVFVNDFSMADNVPKEKLVSLHEYGQLVKTKSPILFLVDDFDKKIMQYLTKYEQKEGKDYFLLSTAAWHITKMRAAQLSVSGNLSCLQSVIKYFGFAVYKRIGRIFL